MENDNGFFAGLALGILMAIVSASIAWNYADDRIKSQAIEAGVAEWTIDAKSGVKKFQWITEGVSGDE